MDNRPNIPLLRKVMEHITAHPEEYDQREYAVRTECGTAHCIAGWAVVLADSPQINYGENLVSRGDLGWIEGVGWSARARELLGIDSLDGAYLFDESRSLPEVWRFVEEISDGEIRQP